MKIEVTEDIKQVDVSPGTYRAQCVGAIIGTTLPYLSTDEAERYAAVQFKFRVYTKTGEELEIFSAPAKIPTRYHSGYNFFKVISALWGTDINPGDVVELPDFDEDELPLFFTKGEKMKELSYIKVNGINVLDASAIIKVSMNQSGTRTKVSEVLSIPD